MALSYTPISELDAVNMMLLSIGESPVNDLNDVGPGDASIARKRLHEVSRDVQVMGWHWNRDDEYPLAPDNDGYINIPSNALRVDPTDDRLKLTIRGTRVYDKSRFSYTFDDVVKFNVVWFLEWDELPQAARNFITRRAAREFQGDTVGAPELSREDARDELLAWTQLLQDEAEVADYNVLTDSPGVARVLDRWL